MEVPNSGYGLEEPIERTPRLKDLCHIHYIKLEEKKTSVLLGYPTQEVFDVDNMFPYHGLWSELGGCLVEVDENDEVVNEYEEDVEVCSECNEAAEKYLETHR